MIQNREKWGSKAGFVLAAAADHFHNLISNPLWIIGYFSLFMFMTIAIVYVGVQRGIERSSKIMMPILFLLLIILMIRGLTLDGVEAGLNFLWNPDWSKITAWSNYTT
jgi:NSS family neurotransmitter:Na+ symporter